MEELNILRHMNVFNPDDFDHEVHVIGAGALGSWVVMMLAKLGLKNITVYDFDIVESHNIPNQLFYMCDVGMTKLSALFAHVLTATNTQIKYVEGKQARIDTLKGVVIMCVDSMKSRKEIYETSIKRNKDVDFLIEARMAADGCAIYSLNPNDSTHIKKYKDTFYDDANTEVSACGSTSTVGATAMYTSSMMTWLLINFGNNEKSPNEIMSSTQYFNILTDTWGV